MNIKPQKIHNASLIYDHYRRFVPSPNPTFHRPHSNELGRDAFLNLEP